MRFSEKNVLVTGATSGIGREAAKLFAQHGAAVTVTGRDKARGQAVVDELASSSAPARFIAADLSDPDDVQRLIRDAGPTDILVNNAGVWELAPTEDTTDSGFDAMFAINVKAPFLLTAAYAPAMAEKGGGAIVNVSTMVASRGVRINAVALGPILTPASEPLAEMLPSLTAAIPLRRAAQPIEVAQAIAYLCGDDAGYVTGAVVPVDGGRQSVL
jgi:NAD(P)-dependent dehydrogenase (short-subunit alcohol dehydrogenase family)